MRRRFRRSTSQEDALDLSDPSAEVRAGASDEGDAEPSSDVTDGPSFDALLARELAQEPGPAEDGGDGHDDAGVDDRAAAAGEQPIADAPTQDSDPSMLAIGVDTDADLATIDAAFAAEEGSVVDIADGADVDDIHDVGYGPLPGDFWDRYDQARAEAELAVVPPAAVVAVVGPLDAAAPVIDRCRDRHWMGQCDVFVLTQLPSIPDHPDWTVIHRPSDLVAVLEDGGSDFPLLVLDVPCDLPAFVRPLVATLREHGVGLIHYVLDDQPADEDLATWHGELGQPSVLDLTGAVPAERVLELVDRGEPVVSVAGNDLSTELLLALRIEQAATVSFGPTVDRSG